jgi:hypothetical protein
MLFVKVASETNLIILPETVKRSLKMQEKITLDLSYCLAEKGFSLDELIFRLSELFKKKAFSEILKLILASCQDALLWRIFNGKMISVCCCGKCDFTLNGGYNRTLKTSLGEVKMFWHRLKCKHCENSLTLLKEFMQLKNYQSKSNELEKIIVDAVSETTYRRGVQSISDHGLIDIPHRTAHDWVMRTDCDEIELSGDIIGSMGPVQVFPDGTKFKGIPKNGQAVKGDLKTIVGVTTNGDVFPLGSYTNESWENINKMWKEKKIKFPDGSIVICDGEPGLAEAFVDQVEDSQRCHWHIGHDLYHSMWQDGATSKEVKPLRTALCGALAIELPEGDFKQVSEAEKDKLEERMERTEDAIDELIRYLHEKGYKVAGNYIFNAKKSMFSYIKRWLKYGLICPRASSLIERITRELARRLKRMAYNWSDKGAGKIARIILKKFINKKEWELYWKKKMNIIGNVYFSIGNYKLSQNFAH